MRDPSTPKHYQLIKWWILVYGGMFTLMAAMTAAIELNVWWIALWLLVWGPPLTYQLFAFRRTLYLKRRANRLADLERHLYDEWWEASDGSHVHRNFLVNGKVMLQGSHRPNAQDLGIPLIDAEWKEYQRRQTAERMLNDAAEFHERHPAATWEPPVGWNDAAYTDHPPIPIQRSNQMDDDEYASLKDVIQQEAKELGMIDPLALNPHTATAAEVSRQLGAAWGEVLAARHAKRDALAAMGHSLPAIDERVKLAETRLRILEERAGNGGQR